MDLKERDSNNRNIHRHPWEQARVKVIHSLLRRVVGQGKEIVMLDIGSGDMYMAEELAKIYPKAKFICVDTGYDKNAPETSAQLISFASLDGFKKNNTGIVDIVLLLDVIEHIKDEADFISRLSNEKYITSETTFIITVPAYQSLFSSHDVFLGHYRRYNRQLLNKKLGNTGLIIESCNYFFFSLVLPRKWQQWKEKQNVNSPAFKGLGQWKGAAFKTTLIKWVLIFDFKLSNFLFKAGIKLPGLSLYAICRKPA